MKNVDEIFSPPYTKCKAKGGVFMELNKNLYIEPRKGKNHLSLDSVWSFTYVDERVEDASGLDFEYSATMPKAAGWCLYEAGILPHPYKDTNSKLYEFMNSKVWYFKKEFTVNAESIKDNAYLCFDGLAYYSRIWLNGILLGGHEGMFGGPTVEISEHIRSGENVLIVECSPYNYMFKESTSDVSEEEKRMHSQPSDLADTNVIAPWYLCNDRLTSNGHFCVVGIWRGVRIEFLNKYHITNPYIFTESVKDKIAILKLEIPITNKYMIEKNGYFVKKERHCWDINPTYDKLTDCFSDENISTEITITAPNGEAVYHTKEKVKMFDLGMTKERTDFIGYRFVRKTIEIEDPLLWYPAGRGEQPLYEVSLKLYNNDLLCDEQDFKTGIRTVEVVDTEGEKFLPLWSKFQFVVNGEKMFIKGMNMAPLDQMLKSDDKDFEWFLRLAANEGIQMMRVWSGGGVPEADKFYELCDRYGIMVYQDCPIANMTTRNWDQDVLRTQLTYNLCRIRNHPSLTVLSGGNEFNFLSKYNAASMYTIQITKEIFAPDRIFYPSCQGGGDIHPYRDMEPTWYRHIYKQVPFISESGIHNFPTYKSLKQVLPEEEVQRSLDNIFSESFSEEFPALRNHFNEFMPARVPRMLARASHICDIVGINLKDLTDATQLSAYEFYLIMIESVMENYPKTAGIMPWVFNRPWPTAAIQLIDGLGNPEAQYYAVKRAYENNHPFIAFEHNNLVPGETISLPVKVMCEREDTTEKALEIKIFDPKLNVERNETYEVKELKSGCNDICVLEFKVPEIWTDKYFFVRVQLLSDGDLLGESIYFPKVLSILKDKEILDRERKDVQNNLLFKNGPWLKPQLGSIGGARLSFETVDERQEGYFIRKTLKIKNEGSVAAYPVIIDSADIKTKIVLSDNFFLLCPGEEREISAVIYGEDREITVTAF